MFRRRFPEFAAESDAAIAEANADASTIDAGADDRRFGYLLAHVLTLHARLRAGKDVELTDEGLGSTPYGQFYQFRLRRDRTPTVVS